MDNVIIKERLPNVHEYLAFRKAVGWNLVNEDACKVGLDGSLYCVCAEINNKIVGIARIIGDSGLYFYIQDVIVFPEYQGLGIGGLLMDEVMDYLGKNLTSKATVGLMASKGKETFYEKYGFSRRPSDTRGHGMYKIWE